MMVPICPPFWAGQDRTRRPAATRPLQLVYPANDDAGMPTAPGRQTKVAPACGSFCNWSVLNR